MERLLPCDGDVLVSHPMARIECEVAVVPRPAHAMYERQDAALANATVLAQALGVDAWLTHDRRHFLRVASFRAVPGAQERATDSPARAHETLSRAAR